jgi:hypothetical protein
MWMASIHLQAETNGVSPCQAGFRKKLTPFEQAQLAGFL